VEAVLRVWDVKEPLKWGLGCLEGMEVRVRVRVKMELERSEVHMGMLWK
jgi:hypothetical protein